MERTLLHDQSCIAGAIVCVSNGDLKQAGASKSHFRDDAGLVLGCTDGIGLAMLRLSSVAQSEGGDVRLIAQSDGAEVQIVPFRPSWWSKEWGKEEEG